MARTVLAALVASLAILQLALPPASAWSNGGYSDDPSDPDYGTHDWIAEHAMRWLPGNESLYIRDNFAKYLYGTELPDNSQAPDGIGDTGKHHVYYYANGTLQDNASAKRASEEFSYARAYLKVADAANAAKTAGVMSHYIVDVAVFGHVMGASTAWGTEVHHSDYESYVTDDMESNVSQRFDRYLVYDGSLDILPADNATLRIAYNTTFGDGAREKSCSWMDTNYHWSDPVFVNSTGAALNRSVNLLTDVLHTLAVSAGYGVVDTTAPSISILSPLEGATLNTTIVNVTGTASDSSGIQKVEISPDGASWTQCSGSTSWNGTLVLPEGPATIRARATDTSNNTNTTQVSVNVSVPDTIPPSVTITFPAEDSHLNSTELVVSGVASDNKGIRSVELTIDNASWRPASGTASWTCSLTLPYGQNTIRAKATDTTGNTNATSVTVTVDDVILPAIAITSPTESAVLTDRNVTVTGTAGDNVAITAVEIGIDNATWVPCAGNSSWTGELTLVDGPNTIYARATDSSGNTNTTSVGVTVSLQPPDTTPPTLIITSPAEGAALTTLIVNVAGTAADPSGVLKVEASLDGSTWMLCNGTEAWSVNLILSEGNYTILVRATDIPGNSITERVNGSYVLPDTTPPAVVISYPSIGAALSNINLTTSGTATDNRAVARVELSLDNQTWNLCVGTTSWTCPIILREGPNTLYARATDTSGNTAFCSTAVTVKFPDITPPQLRILKPSDGSTVTSAGLTMKGEAQDAGGVLRVETSLDGITWKAASGNTSWTARLTLKEGKNLILVRAADPSGNVAHASVNVTYKPERHSQAGLILVVAVALVLVIAVLAIVIWRMRR